MLHPGDVPCYVVLAGIQVPRVIGKGGVIIREIREESGATVSLLDKQLPQSLQSRDQRVALIKGPDAAVHTALSSVIRSALGPPGTQEEGEERGGVVLLLPEKCCPYLHDSDLVCDTACVLRRGGALDGLDRLCYVHVDGTETRQLQICAWRLHELVLRLARARALRDEDFDLRDPLSTVSSAAGVELPRGAGTNTIGPIVWMVMQKEETAWVIGKRGNKISRLRESAGVHINDAPSPPFEPNLAVLEVNNAPLHAELQVLQLVMDDLAMRQGATDETTLLLPSAFVDDVPGLAARESLAAAVQPQARELQGIGREPLRGVLLRGTQRDRILAAAAIYEELQRRNGPGAPAPAQAPPRPATASVAREPAAPLPLASLPSAGAVPDAFAAETRKLREERQREAEEREVRERKARLREQAAQEAKQREELAREARARAAEARDAWNRASTSQGDRAQREALERQALERHAQAQQTWSRSVFGNGGPRPDAAPATDHVAAASSGAHEAGSADREAREREARERELREREARERETREREARERETREREAHERETREREAREREARERQTREREAREREAREREARARDAREREERDREARERDAREREAREREARERDVREREARERDLCEREARERDARERAAREQDLREREAREREAMSRVASPSFPEAQKTGELDMYLLLPTLEVAQYLASESPAIGKRAGARLVARRGSSGEALLQIHGTPTANASACYLVQEALWLSGMFAAC